MINSMLPEFGDPGYVRTESARVISGGAEPLVPGAAGAPAELRAFRPDGPVFAGKRPAEARTADPALFRPALDGAGRFAMGAFALLWAGFLGVFAWWWFDPAHVTGPWAFALNTAVIGYLLLLPGIFIYRMRRLPQVRADAPVPDLRTAFVVTRAPSESWAVVRETIEAMLDQDIGLGYDVWLCDETPTPEILGWCAGAGVNVSTREGVESYHREEWPRRTKCKEGNLAFFYDTVGYRDYDVVAQLDCDHVPDRGYLREMLKPFADPAVGFVAAPSVCGANAGESWSARGRLYMESIHHGAFQLSHNGGAVPIAIGSHYAVRTKALREVGGIGPELAEDYSTSYMLRLGGYDGVFAIDARAEGLGPNTWAAMVTQEFQWTRSLAILSLGLVPRTLGRLPWALRARFMFAATFNAVFGLVMAAGFLLAPAAVIAGRPWVSVNFLEFVVLFAMASFPLFGMVLVLKRSGLLRPVDAPLVSWEVALYKLARLPFLWRGALSGLWQVLTGRRTGFRVTPKDRDDIEPFTLAQSSWYLLLALANCGIGLWGTVADRAFGYAGLTLFAGLCFGVVAVAVPALHAHELKPVEAARGPRLRAVAPALAAGIAATAITAAAFAYFLYVLAGMF